jgi:hypothetical protein
VKDSGIERDSRSRGHDLKAPDGVWHSPRLGNACAVDDQHCVTPPAGDEPIGIADDLVRDG